MLRSSLILARASVVLPLLISAACSSTQHTAQPEARSLIDDRAYNAPPLDPETRAALEANLAQAQADYDRAPGDVRAIIWLGRRLAYLGRYADAIDVYSKGLESHPESVHLLRHRGHRYITIRQFRLAQRDLERAVQIIERDVIPDEIEPDGLPNVRNIPLSTLHDNVWYHLALARYLQRDFRGAADAWRAGLERVRPNDDMLVAYSYWLALAEHRANRPASADLVLHSLPELASLDIIENESYRTLLRVFRGELEPAQAIARATSATDFVTTHYALGAWALIHGDARHASTFFRRALSSTSWHAFGFIAAEAELAHHTFEQSRLSDPEGRQDERLKEIQRERMQNR